MAISHSARLSPLQGETVWTLDGDIITETRGRRTRRFELARLKSLHSAEGGAVLTFARGRLTIPAMSYTRGLRPENRAASFAAFVGAVAAAAAVTTPGARFRNAGAPMAEPLIWMIGLLGGGALMLLLFAATAGAWTLGVALAARLVFVMILAAGALPWLNRASRPDA
ncbi:MAG: hypothetical protein WA047_13520 [Phenylobacterium sp.]|uniref:hypothetical protein n=1 Tax=Phenylobacterium sp. TaxID=1871053 RepID=UPI003BB49260